MSTSETRLKTFSLKARANPKNVYQNITVRNRTVRNAT